MSDIEPKEEEGIKSPFVPEIPPAQFDYNKYQDETTVKAAIEILKCFGRNAELIVFKHDAKSDIMIDNMGKVAQEMINIMIDCKVPDSDFQKLSDMITQSCYGLFKMVVRQNNEFEKELLARMIGVRDPGTKKYSREFASMGDMFTALYKLRAEQGNNVEDYYTLEKKKEE